jgi:hypothetical protein
MYKSRLHQWGLDKKKKEHEMLDVIRVGYKRKDIDRDSVFQIRGRPVTLGDALHYFSRKGIKDPTSLLDASPEPVSSPSDADSQSLTDLPLLLPVRTESDLSIDDAEGSMTRSVSKDDQHRIRSKTFVGTSSNATENRAVRQRARENARH